MAAQLEVDTRLFGLLQVVGLVVEEDCEVIAQSRVYGA